MSNYTVAQKSNMPEFWRKNKNKINKKNFRNVIKSIR
uniref:Uncharacterized protein n=1 Tax=Anguilla anguilla TaxID=7936 RepID=A0A0E9TYE4_ANGAN